MNTRLKDVYSLSGALLFLFLNSQPSLAVPRQINHQGVVKVNGVPFSGIGEFRFAIVDPDSGANGWTNDGSSLYAVGVPAAGIQLPVANGLYSVRLGDESLPGMFPIPTGIFGDDNLVLRVWFNDGANGLSQLVPDHPLTASPYSFRALNGVPSGFSILSETLEAPAGFSSTHLQIPAGDSWLARASLPTARTRLAVGVVDNRIYAIGGFNPSDQPVALNEMYDPATNLWTPRANMPTPRGDLAIGVVNGEIYAIGGTGTPEVAMKNEKYNPATNMWTTMEPMPTARGKLAIGVVRGKIYAIGGGFADTPSNRNDEYDPQSNSWAQKAPMPIGRLNAAAGVITRNFSLVIGGSKGGLISNFRDVIAVLGGQTQMLPPTTTPTNLYQEYDPAKDEWNNRAPLPSLKSDVAVGVVANKIYAIGGRAFGSSPLSDNDRYDPVSDTWTPLAPPIVPRYDHSAAVVEDKIYLIGGSAAGGELRSVEEYSPETALFVHLKD
jgi:N-acetylneuraminic acid mutarotase